MFAIEEINIIPTFKCNLNCDYCLYSELRKTESKTVLALDNLKKILGILKKEGNLLKRVCIFGGEILLLEKDYMFDLFKLVRSFFPTVAFGVVTNLLEVPSWFESLIKSYDVSVSTSYEGLRFSPESNLYKEWKKNLKFVRKFVSPRVNFVLTKDNDAYRKACEVIIKEKFDYIYLVDFAIPDYFPKEKKEYLFRKYALTPEKYYKSLCNTVKYFSKFNVMISYTFGSVNTFEVRPDASIVLTFPSDEGYPFEKEVTINYQEEGTITFSRKRIEQIAKWLNNSSKITLGEYSECKK
ncbi:radical SAM protein [Caldisericum sp.]|uniref:radical SAM protein n=1 Tax=Caldisericum sp. TaxID=2499687 RepID=UPI003D0B2421